MEINDNDNEASLNLFRSLEEKKRQPVACVQILMKGDFCLRR